MGLSYDDALLELEATPPLLRELVDRLTEPQLHHRPPRGVGGDFAVVEHLWHLADLEAEGFGARIDLLLAEEEPFLPDFDGAHIARERNYLSRRTENGLRAFAAAREANVAVLRSLSSAERRRAGSQQNVGEVALGSLPQRMRQHDRAHFAELVEALDALGLGALVPTRLRAGASDGGSSRAA